MTLAFAVLGTFLSLILGTVGGEEQFTKMSEWAGQNLSAEQLDAYNKSIDSGDSATQQMALSWLKGQFEAGNPQAPTRVRPESPSTKGSGERYESIAQMQNDMADPRYDKDSAFRDQVERKLANSNIL